MKDKIIDYLQDEKRALEVIDIYNLLGLKTIDELNDIKKELEDMESQGLIFKTNKGKYILFQNCPGVFCGVLQVNQKGFGFVIIPRENDLYIPSDNLNGAVNGDLVVCEITKKDIKPEGRIIKILKRDLHNIVGEIIVDKSNRYVFSPDDKNLGIHIKLDRDTLKNCVEGTKVLVSIGNDLGNNFYSGSIIKILGHKNDPGMDIKSIAYKYGIYDEFTPDSVRELDSI